MNLPKNINVRNRAVILTLLPVIILLWLIGWSLFWTGSRNTPQKPKRAAETDTPITIGILLENYEEYNT